MIAHSAQIIFLAIMKFKRKHYSIRWLIDVSIEREHKRYDFIYNYAHHCPWNRNWILYTYGQSSAERRKKLNA